MAKSNRRRYAAFISYSHDDREIADWLHDRLESYRLPRQLIKSGVVAADQIAPVFLDRREIGANSDLSEAVVTALTNSRTLIVVCSPGAVASRWVGEEVRRFKMLGRSNRIFCLIVGGSPNATTRQNRDPAAECYPASLRYELDDDGQVTEQPAPESFGADIRNGMDSRRTALLKLAAGVSGVDFALLERRDEQRRQRRVAAVVTTSSALTIIMAGLATFAWLSRADALAARELAEQQRQRAEIEASRAVETADFLKSLFKVSDPSVSRGNAVTAREILDRGVERIEDELVSQPRVRIALQTTLGEVYTGLGLFAEADRLLAGASVAAENMNSAKREQLQAALVRAEVVYLRGEYPLAENLFREAERLSRHPATNVSAVERLRIHIGLGEVMTQLEKDAEARVSLQTAESIAKDYLEEPVLMARVEAGLATLAFYSGELESAASGFSRALETYTTMLGEDHPQTGQMLNQLGAVNYMQGNFQEAAAFYERALPTVEKVYGSEHPETAALLNNYARLVLERGDFEQAVTYFDRIVSIDVAQKPADHDDFIYTYNSRGLARLALGRCTQAAADFTAARSIAERHEHPMLGVVLVNQAQYACEARESSAVEALLEEAIPMLEKTYGPDHWRVAWSKNIAAACLQNGGDPPAAEALAGTTAVLVERWGSLLFGSNALRRLQAVDDAHALLQTASVATSWAGCTEDL